LDSTNILYFSMLSRRWSIRRTFCEGNLKKSVRTGLGEQREQELAGLHFPGPGGSLVCVMNRRKFLCSTVATAAASAFPQILQADSIASASAHLTIQSDQPGQPIPKDFLGLSYEMAQLSHPEYFSAKNDGLAGFLRPLGQGVLRIGGNSSEYAFWTPHPAKNAAAPSSAPIGPDKGHKPPANTQTTPESIHNLRQFLEMVDWRAIYGLNLGKGTPRQAAEEAAFVFDKLGDRLISFQIGNEADLYHNNGLRPANYDYAAFAQDWKAFYEAVKARVPSAKFAGPDTSGSEWIVPFAQQFGTDVVELSTHYYALGPASNPAMNIERLLSPNNPRWDSGVPRIRQAMAESHLPYRLTETNSCYGGGKPDVSNTFASSLWALDLMFNVLAVGGCGINFHGGGYGWYAPIVGTLENGFVARPEYYALLVVAQLLGGHMVASQLDAGDAGPLFVAYAVQDAQGRLRAVAINKNGGKNVRLKLQTSAAGERVSLERLIAPSLDDEQDTTLAGSAVGADGSSRPGRVEHLAVTNGSAQCDIPAGSAVLLSWE
jgi:Glycosyl hydrolase family 79 C-terminal beta domain